MGSVIALETGGNWYWMGEGMEKDGHFALLTNEAKAKTMTGKINKTDKLNSRGLATLFHKRWARKHAAKLYFRLRARKGHGKAVVAVARHLAEAAYWVLKKKNLMK